MRVESPRTQWLENGVPEGIRPPDPRFRNAPEGPQKTSAHRKVSFNVSAIAYHSVSGDITRAAPHCPQIVPGDNDLFSSSKRIPIWRISLGGLTDPVQGRIEVWWTPMRIGHRPLPSGTSTPRQRPRRWSQLPPASRQASCAKNPHTHIPARNAAIMAARTKVFLVTEPLAAWPPNPQGAHSRSIAARTPAWCPAPAPTGPR